MPSAPVPAYLAVAPIDNGGILFAATTSEVENPDLNPFVLSHLASELAWEAVLTSFQA